MGCWHPKWIYLPKSIKLKYDYEPTKDEYEETFTQNAKYEVNQKILRKPHWHYTKNSYAIQIPCGECPYCILEHAKENAIKCYCEMQEHKEACFITLTYNNGYRTIKGQEKELSLPLTEKGKEKYNELIKIYQHNETMKILAKLQIENQDIMELLKKDLCNFWKRLRKYLDKQNIKIRYLACGERGGTKKRVHFHALIFGWKPEDLKLYKINHLEQKIYKSEILQKIWGCGFCTIGEANFKTASYVARYVQKKFYSQHGKLERKLEFEQKYTMAETMEILEEYRTYYDKRPISKDDYIQNYIKLNSVNRIIKDKKIPNEFLTCSNKPGIGLNYFLKNIEKIKRNNGIIIKTDYKNTKIVKVPRYFKKKWQELNWEEFYNWAYQQQQHAEKERLKQIKLMKYPKKWEDWQKEIAYEQHNKKIFLNKINKLVRKNYDD